jgi:hypothetical protein
MKTKTLTLGLLLFFLTNCLAQKDKLELGWYIAPSFSFYEKSDIGSNNKFSTGIFYNVYSTKVFGFGAGVDYHQLNLNVAGRVGQQNKFNFLKFPVWTSINTNYYSSAKTRTYFLLGMAYGNLLNAESARVAYNLKGLKQNHFFVNIGLQLKRPLNEAYQFTLGTHLELTNIYDVRYGNIYSFQVVFGVGRIWK